LSARTVRVRRLFRRFRSGPYPRLPTGHVSQSLPTIPDGRISRVRFWPRLSRYLSGRAFLPCGETAVLAHPPPRRHGVCIAPSPQRGHRRIRLSVRVRAHRHGRRVPRVPLPGTGVTRAGAASRAAWRGVTPSSSLIRAHAPDHPPPNASGSPLAAGSLQVVASPCCEMALPDIISAILARVPGPVPRRAPRLHISASSPRTPVSPQPRRVRRANLPPHGSFRGDIAFEAAVIRSPSGSRAC
jgi:hypothetical protein